MRRRRGKNPEALFATSIRFPKELKAFVEKRARDADRSVSYIVVEVLRQWRDFEEKVPKTRKPVEAGA